MAKWNIGTADDTFDRPLMYRHVRTGVVYELLYHGLEVTGDDGVPSIIYRNNGGDVFIQSRNRFEDGRFELL